MAEVFKDPRKKEYLNAEGADKPLKSPIPLATLKKARGLPEAAPRREAARARLRGDPALRSRSTSATRSMSPTCSCG